LSRRNFQDEGAAAQEQFHRRHIHFSYLGLTQQMNEPHWQALEQETRLLKRRIFNDAGSLWEGLNTSLEMDIVRVSQDWSKIAPNQLDIETPACPMSLTDDEIQKRGLLDASLREVDYEMERINNILGVACDGWTRNEYFPNAKERARSIKEKGLAAVNDDPWLKEMTERHWPFDDYNED
jgi:hypothetical protein